MRPQVQQLVAKRCSWDPVEKLQRLEGFAETWERVLYRGRELAADKTLAAAGLPDTVTITAVRKVLVPEGWKVSLPPQALDNLDVDTLCRRQDWHFRLSLNTP